MVKGGSQFGGTGGRGAASPEGAGGGRETRGAAGLGGAGDGGAATVGLVSTEGTAARRTTGGGTLAGASGLAVPAGAAALEPRDRVSHPIPTTASRVATATRPTTRAIDGDRGTPCGKSEASA
jgi:hypothetical protein